MHAHIIIIFCWEEAICRQPDNQQLWITFSRLFFFHFHFCIDKLFYSLEFSEVILNESSNDYEAPLPDYTSIIEELKSHRREIKKLHQECTLPPEAVLEGFTLLFYPHIMLFSLRKGPDILFS